MKSPLSVSQPSSLGVENSISNDSSNWRLNRFHWQAIFLCVVWVFGVIIVAASTFPVMKQEMLEELEQDAAQMALTIDQHLTQFEGIATAVSDLRTLRQVLNQPTPDGVATLNRILVRTNETLGSNSIYVLNRVGTVIGSSNFGQSDAFNGHNFAFRPYFQQAVLGQRGSYYAQGTVSGRRGYYFSSPIFDEEKVIGVAVVKIELDPLFQQLSQWNRDFLVVGFDGVVFAASREEWSYRSLHPLSDEQRRAIHKSRRYGDSSLVALGAEGWGDPFEDEVIRLSSGMITQRYLVQRGLIPQGDWHIFTLTTYTELVQQIAQLCIYFSVFYGLLVLLWLYWHKRLEVQAHVRSMNTELERRVTELTSELTTSNAELKDMVAHYQTTQTELEQTQDQLVQTAKLAVLGELSAGINHELNQPLLALQTYAENSLKLAQRERHDMVKDNLSEILQITKSMHSIVSRFKVFARRSPPEPRPIAVNEVIDGALVIMAPLVRKHGIELVIDKSNSDVMILCEPVQVQQVLVNLITNATEAIDGMRRSDESSSGLEAGSLQAMAGANGRGASGQGVSGRGPSGKGGESEARIRLFVSSSTHDVAIRVADSGPGIAPEVRARIFEPFYTTKQKGLGIGLALSRRIMETLKGRLEVEDSPSGGTLFTLTLPRWCESAPAGEEIS